MPRDKALKLATFNVNGINARLENLLHWLEEEKPDVVALQELKATDQAFPVREIEAAGYGALWHGQQSWNGVALLGRDTQPLESRRGLPGDPADKHSRYIEAAIHGLVVAGLYLPNGNPRPGPRVDRKCRPSTNMSEEMASCMPGAGCSSANIAEPFSARHQRRVARTMSSVALLSRPVDTSSRKKARACVIIISPRVTLHTHTDAQNSATVSWSDTWECGEVQAAGMCLVVRPH